MCNVYLIIYIYKPAYIDKIIMTIYIYDNVISAITYMCR